MPFARHENWGLRASRRGGIWRLRRDFGFQTRAIEQRVELDEVRSIARPGRGLRKLTRCRRTPWEYYHAFALDTQRRMLCVEQCCSA
jgi:hypothetical protein